MRKLRVLIADDEPLVRRDLVRHLHADPEFELVGEARNGVEALQQVDELTPDILLLDIQMPELDGLGVVAALDPDSAPVIVFVTAYDQYAIQAFDAGATDYLLKPFDADRLQRALARARLRVQSGNNQAVQQSIAALAHADAKPRYLDRLAVRVGRRITVIKVSDVQWIEAADNYARLHTASGTVLTRRTMKELAAILDPANFSRVHRSAIVNVQHVAHLEPLRDGEYRITLRSGAAVTLSRSYRDGFQARLGGIG